MKEKYVDILDHGFVGLIDVMGEDESIDQAARVSYGKGTRKVSNVRGLVRYLMRHRHTTPTEMLEFKFHCKMPIFVARQWVRHRTANINEYSARYSILDNEYYVPEREHMAPQSTTNNQGRSEELLEEHVYDQYKERIIENSERAYNLYERLLNEEENPKHNPYVPGIARELARMVLPINFYTQWYWKIDLHNLFHFLSLRMDAHSQWEIQVYAKAMYELIKPYCPLACEAFEDYNLNGVHFSKQEFKILKDIMKTHDGFKDIDDCVNEVGLSKREAREFFDKFDL